MRRNYTVVIGILSLLLFSVGCKKKGGINDEVTKITVAPQKIQLGIGKTDTLYARPFPDGVNAARFKWSSNAPEVAAVDNGGRVTGISEGYAHIVVQYGSFADSVLIEVFEPLTGIQLSPSASEVDLKIEFGVAGSVQYTALPLPDKSTESISWKTSNAEVAVVSPSGLITAMGEGDAVITVSGSMGEVKKEITVHVTVLGDSPVQFDSKLFKRSILPGDNYLDRTIYWFIEGIWDGNEDNGGGSSCSLPGPQAFTFDMGQTGLLAYFQLYTWMSLGEGYPPFYESNVKKFEVWGCEDLDQSGSWDSWTKLMDCEVDKPSGLPLGEYNDADIQAKKQGQRFYNKEHYEVPVRYIRVKVLETWGGMPCWRISEIKLFGEIL